MASVKESVKEEVEMPAIEEEDSALPPKRIVISRVRVTYDFYFSLSLLFICPFLPC